MKDALPTLAEMIVSELSKEPKPVEIVRLKTSSWKNKQGVHYTKSLLFQRRKSSGFQLLEEDASMICPSEVMNRVTNLFEVDDGLYHFRTCNESRDYETGIIDDYDYVLIPYQPEIKPEPKTNL